MTSNKILIGATIVLLLCLAFVTFRNTIQKVLPKKQIVLPPNIQNAKTPTYVISGEIASIAGNRITLKKTYLSSNDSQNNFTSQNYNIEVKDDTQIYQPAPSGLTFFFSTPPSIPERNLTMQDLGVGRYIQVTSETNLKTLQNNTITAESIELASPIVAIKGTVTAVTPTNLTIETDVSADTFGADPKPMTKKTIQFQLTPNTEVSRIDGPREGITPTPEHLSLKDVKTGMNVSVITNKDVFTSSDLTALRIEPLL